MGRVSIEFTGDASKLVAEQSRAVKGAAEITSEYKKIVAETAKLDREAARVWEKTATPLEKYNVKMKDLNKLLDAGKISQEQFGRAASLARVDLDKQGSSLSALLASGGTKLAGMVAGFVGVQQAISAINAQYTAWIENERKLGKETIATTGGARAFAALQPGPLMQARVQEVLRETGGRMPSAQAFDIVQGLQSASGDYATALREFRDTILKARDLGMKPELAQELVNMARPLGVDPALFVRQAYITGVAATRGTNEIAAAAVGLTSWNDKLLGMAAAGQITGLRGMEGRPYLEQAGIGLSGVSPAAEWFKRQGLGQDATQEQRLRMLRTKGIDTMEELQQIGISEIRMMGGLTDLVTNLPNVEKYRAAVLAGTEPGKDVLGSTIANIERWLPSTTAERLVEEAKGRRMAAEFAPEMAAKRAAQSRAAAALTEQGWLGGRRWGVQAFDEEGQINPLRFIYAADMELLFGWLRGGSQESVRRAMREGMDAFDKVERNTRPRPAIPAPER